MKRRQTPEQIIRKLKESEADRGSSSSLDQVCRKLATSEATFHHWRKLCGDLKGPEMRRLKGLQRENARLKKLLAEQVLDNALLKEVLSGKYRPRRGGGRRWGISGGAWRCRSVGRARW